MWFQLNVTHVPKTNYFIILIIKNSYKTYIMSYVKIQSYLKNKKVIIKRWKVEIAKLK